MHKLIRLFLFLGLLLLVRLFTSCFVPSVFNAGGEQSFWVWQWLAKQHQWLPHKDFFYPYGLMPYYAKGNDVISWVYSFTTAVAIFSILQWIWYVVKPMKHRWKTVLAIALSTFFVWYALVVYSVEFTARYGLGLAYGLWSVRLLLQPSQRKDWLIFGMLWSGLFFLVPDQGVYSSILLLSALLFGWILSNKPAKKYVLNLRLNVFTWCIGAISVGLVGLIAMGSNNLLLPFFRSLNELRWISIYAESSFLPYAGVPENLFIIGCIYAGLTILAWRSRKAHKPHQSFLLLSIAVLTTLTLLLEYKSIIRSVAEQIILICIPLSIVMVSYVSQLFPSKLKQIALWIGASLVCFFLGIYMPKRGEALSITHLTCSVQKVSSLPILSPEYQSVFQELQRLQPKKVFAFPGDPIFYSFFNQQPPYTLYSYNYAPNIDQQRILEYLRDVDTVVWNTQFDSMDGVPTILRTPHVSKYIVQQYVPVKKVGSFLILKPKTKSKMQDWMSWTTAQPFFSQLNLGMTPLNFKPSTQTRPIDKFQLSVGKVETRNSMNSTKELLLYSSEPKAKPTQITLKLTASDSQFMIVSMSGCSQRKCVLPLHVLPLFYFDSALQSIELTQGENVTVELYSTGME